MPNMRKSTTFVVLATVVLLVVSPSAYALRVGWNVDIHQNKFGDPNDPGGDPSDYANDFHIWGILESGSPPNWLPAPTLTTEVNFKTSGPPPANPPWQPQPPPPGTPQVFETFTHQISQNPVNPRPLPPMAPPIGGPFYYFDANWSTAAQIPFCTWWHFGLEFEEECHNIGYWLQGVWTKDGVDPAGNPIYGFDVQDWAPRPYIRIQNASGMETEILQMDLMVLDPLEGAAFELADLNTNFFDENPTWNNRWVPVPQNLLPTQPLPGTGEPDSFFDVFFDVVPGLNWQGLGQVLLARQRSTGSEEWWQYELHGSHTIPPPVIPEPSTFLIWALGLVGLAWYARRRRR